MAKRIKHIKAHELAKDNEALAKAYNVSKSSSRDTFISILKSLLSNRQALVGMIILVVYILVAVFGPMLADPKMLKSNIRNRLSPPTREHLLGTDNNGRDTLTQFVYGARNVLTVAFIAAVMTVLIATTVGMTAGLFGRMGRRGADVHHQHHINRAFHAHHDAVSHRDVSRQPHHIRLCAEHMVLGGAGAIDPRADHVR